MALLRGAKYIDKAKLFKTFDDIVLAKGDNLDAFVLVYACIASGAKYEGTRDIKETSVHIDIAQTYFEKAIEVLRRVGGQYSTTKFKVMFTNAQWICS